MSTSATSRRIVVIVGHPDPEPNRLCRALAETYSQGARSAGHEIETIDIARLDFPFLRTMEEFSKQSVPATLEAAAAAIRAADHIFLVFPLWLGTMPALLKAFLEQVMRPGVAFAYPDKSTSGFAQTLLNGKSARIVVTMGMPAPFYRFWYLGHGIAGLRRNILNFVGISPVRETLLGMVDSASERRRQKWLQTMIELGSAAR